MSVLHWSSVGELTDQTATVDQQRTVKLIVINYLRKHICTDTFIILSYFVFLSDFFDLSQCLEEENQLLLLFNVEVNE